MPTLLDLPAEVLDLVKTHLEPNSFLALCRTCKAFYSDESRFDSFYWRNAVRITFRVPNQPLAEGDGKRWCSMYKRLLTQTKVFTWGQDKYGCLNHDPPNKRENLPDQICSALGIIADMQCGGWSTTILNDQGTLYTAGLITEYESGQRSTSDLFITLTYPSGHSIKGPSTQIRQFSSGRDHVLGLSDGGMIWSWHAVYARGHQIKFLQIDDTKGKVEYVKAGWAKSSAYIAGTGIVIWDPVRPNRFEATNTQRDENDTMLVLKHPVVPKTAYIAPSRAQRGHITPTIEVGQVQNYVVLENFVVFVTHVGKVFATNIDDSPIQDPIELTSLNCNPSNESSRFDIQGSFRTFAVLSEDTVTISDQAYLSQCWSQRHQLQDTSSHEQSLHGIRRIPALQNSGVIQMAFGDYHFHALHKDGHITSYGKGPQGQGALGFGRKHRGTPAPDRLSPCHLRGIKDDNFMNDQSILSCSEVSGRQIWFPDDLHEHWLNYLCQAHRFHPESKARFLLTASDSSAQAFVSEWVEQQGRDWDKIDDPDIQAANKDGLGSHFALAVSAAGWHSGALVLVNDELNDAIKNHFTLPVTTPVQAAVMSEFTDIFGGDGALRMWNQFISPRPAGPASPGLMYRWATKGLPRLRLGDGIEMPGTVEFDDWKEGKIPDYCCTEEEMEHLRVLMQAPPEN